MPRIGRLAAVGVGALALAAALATTAAPRVLSPGFWGPTLKHPAPPPDFALRDQRGELIRLSELRGKVVLLTFLYTHCPDLCPLTATNINTAIGTLGAGSKDVVALAVSVDPRGDTPASVKSFVRTHRLLPQFHYLTGSRAALTGIWSAYQVQAVRHPGEDVDHTLYTLLIDRTGKGRVLFDSRAAARTIRHDVRLLLP